MDKIRFALVAALALVSFMMLVEFGKFNDERNKLRIEQQASSASASTSTNLSANNVPANPVVAENQANNLAQDIPVASPALSAPLTTTVKSADGLLQVKTDTLTAKIDPVGGDIVYLALNKFSARLDTPDIPFVLLENTENRSYTLQSGLVGVNGVDIGSTRPVYSVSQTAFTMDADADSLVVDLSLTQNNVFITKRFTFYRNTYLVDIDYLVNNNSSENWQAKYFAQIKRDNSVDPASQNNMMGVAPYLGFAVHTKEERFKKVEFEDLKEKPLTEVYQGGWVALIQHYFLTSLIPDKNQPFELSTLHSQTGFNIARITSSDTVIAPQGKGSFHATFYAGPKNQYTLSKISEGLDLSVDYGVLWMIAQPLYALLYFFYTGDLHAFGHEFKVFSGIGNWGFAIILLTILVKLCFYSLNAKAYNSMAKMREIQPKMLEIKDRYAEDKQMQSKEMMALYSKEGVNPLGGCLPMLVQMPVFLSLYWVLLESVELRQAPFIGYIHDLSAMDPYFILPLIMGFSMYVQQKLNPPPPDPMQAKVMQFLPVIFTFFFLFFPSGLVLYWVVNNTLSILQQWIITKRIEAKRTK